MKPPKMIDNKKNGTVAEELRLELTKDSKLSVMTAYFTIFAFAELKKELMKADRIRLLFTDPVFIKGEQEQTREYYLERNGGQAFSGNVYEMKLRNEMCQAAVAKECAKWLESKADIKVFRNKNSAQPRMIYIDNGDDSVCINGTVDFTTDGLGLTHSDRVDSNMWIYQAFKACGYLNEKDEVTDSLKIALKTNMLQVPAELAEHKHAIASVCKKAAGGLNIKPANDKRPVHLNKERFLSEDFKELWDRIKYKTTYKVEFDSEKLVEQCCEKMQLELNVGAAKLMYTKAKVQVSEGGVDTTETQRLSVMTTDGREQLPDIITYLQNRNGLTRRTIVKILTESKTLHLFKKNPQAYMDQVAKLIGSTMQLFIVDGIKYTKLGDTEFYAQELFDSEELTGYLERNMFESHRSVYDYVVYDSDVERGFAEQLETNESVKVYAKLPDWFKVPTPLGSYNPDWAVVIEDNGLNKLYFVVETKGSIEGKDLRPKEQAKIRCGEKHFAALGNGAKFMKADSFGRFVDAAI